LIFSEISVVTILNIQMAISLSKIIVLMLVFWFLHGTVLQMYVQQMYVQQMYVQQMYVQQMYVQQMYVSTFW
jgi:hypothetical protein